LLVAEHTAPLVSYITELAGRNTENGKCFDPLVLDQLKLDNPRLFQWLNEAGIQFRRCY
jgi:hypothetical protein